MALDTIPQEGGGDRLNGKRQGNKSVFLGCSAGCVFPLTVYHLDAHGQFDSVIFSMLVAKIIMVSREKDIHL